MTSHDDGGDDDGDDDDDPFRFKTGLACFAKLSLMPSMNCYAYVPMIMMMMMMMMTTTTTMTIAIAIAMTCYDLLFFAKQSLTPGGLGLEALRLGPEEMSA